MKAEFQGWYETVHLTLDPRVMEAREATVLALAGSVSDAELEALTRATFRSDQTFAATGTVRTRLADKGGAIGDEEFALLAAATLDEVLRRSGPTAARAATMICTAHFKGLRTVKQPMDIVGLGASARLALALATRRRPPLQLTPIQPLGIDTTQTDETDDADENIKLLAGAMQRLSDRQTDFEQRALRYISIQDEELNMLWWLQGGRSHAGQLFEEIPREQQPFVLAHDLAEITFAMPGASAIGSLLERAGIKDSDPLEVAAAIQALPIEWLKTALPETDRLKTSPVTTPLHEGIRRRLEVRGENTWIAGWAGVCDINTASRLTPLQLADLWYCEQLLIHK